MATIPYFKPDQAGVATIRAGINSHKTKATTMRRVSCGCCTNGCVCFMHRDVQRGLLMQKCAVHSGTGKEEKVCI